MIFRTPYACPEDVFYVYPVLSERGKKRWTEIENDRADRVTTLLGYHNQRRNLFVNEGLCADGDLQKKTGIMSSNIDQHKHQSDLNFVTKGDEKLVLPLVPSSVVKNSTSVTNS